MMSVSAFQRSNLLTFQRVNSRNAITVEQLLYAVLLCVALGLRLAGLGRYRPVGPLEAMQTLPAWIDAVAWRSGDMAMSLGALPQSPLLYTGQRFLFWLTGGGGDMAARILPAVTGALLVLLPWGLRPVIGRRSALILAGLFVIDPWLLSASRLADGAMLSVVAAIFCLVCAVNWAQWTEGYSRLADVRLRFAAFGIGLSLVSGPLFWLYAPLLVLATALFNIGSLERWKVRTPGVLVVYCAFGIVVGATGGLAHWDGMGTISTSLTVALEYVTGGGTAQYPVSWPWLRLFIDQPLLWSAGVVGLILMIRQARPSQDDRRVDLRENASEEKVETSGDVQGNGGGHAVTRRTRSNVPALMQQDHRFPLFMLAWLVYGSVLLLLPGRNPASLLIIGPVLAVMSAYALSNLSWRLEANVRRRARQQEVAHGNLAHTFQQSNAGPLIGIALTVLIVTCYFWTAYSIAESRMDWQAALFYLIVPLLVGFFAWWSGARTAVPVTLAVVAGWLFLATVSSSWTMNYAARGSTGHTKPASALYATTADNAVWLLADDVQRLSSLRTGDATLAPVQVQLDGELGATVAWALRDMKMLSVGGTTVGERPDTVPANDASDRATMVITPEGESPANAGTLFVGSDFTVLQHWLPSYLSGGQIPTGARTAPTEDGQAFMTWVLFRESNRAPVKESVILWVRREP